MINKLVEYALKTGLITPAEELWATNAVLETLGLDEYEPVEGDFELEEILTALGGNEALMGRLTPRPQQVIDSFWEKYSESPQAATDWYYKLSQDTNYIRRSRMPLDVKWTVETKYGELEITINLSKPEKDPREIAAALATPPSGYPKCLLCAENEGYAGRPNHPARQNHRIIPIEIGSAPWYLQYSPYVYYNEHCIVLNKEHIPMKIDRACFDRLLDFVEQFPHYFVGSNADLPIVGGSILSHDHFQGGRHSFAMERAEIAAPLSIPGFEDVAAGIVSWPMSVIRIASPDRGRLALLAERILDRWRGYSDPDAFIFAQTGGVPHNTITPIARRRGGSFELDLVLRSNITSGEFPGGVFHPHEELHHIKKENIGLIEVMGLAVLPSRLKAELAAVAEGLLSGADLRKDPLTAAHADWAYSFAASYELSAENALDVVYRETGLVFLRVLEQAGVFKNNESFLRFIQEI